jgi:hypothetical protein
VAEENDITSFLDKRPHGVAFDDDKKVICFLEFTRAMDSREGWEARKDDEKRSENSSVQVQPRMHQ